MKILNSKASGYLCVAIAAVAWGSNGVVVNRVLLNAYAIAFFRVLFASLALLPLVLLTEKRRIVEVLKAWRSMLVLGLLLSLGWGLLFQSMKLIAIANAVLLNYLAPIFVAVLSPIFLKERIERITIIALITSMAGVIMISSQQSFRVSNLNLLGVIFGLLAGFAYAGFIVLSKKALAKFSSRAVALSAYSMAMIFLSPSLIDIDLTIDSASWILLLVLGVFNTGFAVTLYLKGLRIVKAQKAVVFTYLEPVSALVFGFFFLAQPPTLLMVVGGILILFAGYFVASK